MDHDPDNAIIKAGVACYVCHTAMASNGVNSLAKGKGSRMIVETEFLVHTGSRWRVSRGRTSRA